MNWHPAENHIYLSGVPLESQRDRHNRLVRRVHEVLRSAQEVLHDC